MKYYSGIGSRETPDTILALMQVIGAFMARKDFTLRSGAAGGADAAFETGCDNANGAKDIYLPWRGFNGHSSTLNVVSKAALDMAAQFHPAWEACSEAAKKLHARNCYQVLGTDLATPAACVICWTPDCQAGGGTGQAIRIARHHGIEVFDLAIRSVRDRIERQLAAAGHDRSPCPQA